MSTGGIINQHKGLVSPNARRKIRTAIDWLIASADEKYLFSKKTGQYHSWKISFCTLTLPTQGELGDIEIKHILNAWLTFAKYAFGLKSYIWKAEPQARGTIHIHITSDCFMWHKTVRDSWNKLLKKYQLLNGHEDPNSTDIHSTYKIKNIAAYLCKYFTKQSEDRRAIKGRLWGCSRTLSNARGIRFEMPWSDMKYEVYHMRKEAIHVHQKDYCESFYMRNNYLRDMPACKLKSIFQARARMIRKTRYLNQFEVFSMETGVKLFDKNPPKT